MFRDFRCIVLPVLAGLLACMPALAGTKGLKREVNTFIGTKDDGNTFPGASAPFGMIQVSPITEHYAGYRYDDKKIRGFGHSFVSGAGCWEQGGQVAVLPVTGTIGPGGRFDTSDAKAKSFDYKAYAASYTHQGEVGQAGYYKVRLTDAGGIDAEATALTRAAAERYTFAASEKTGHVLVNVGQANEKHEVVGSVIEVVGDRAVEGKLVTSSFCGGKQYTTWFRIEFDRAFKAFGTWDRDGGIPGGRHSVGTQWDVANGAWLSFDLGDARSVTATSAISHVDADGARRNLDAEGKRDGKLLGFDAMRTQAQAAWRKELAVVRIDGASADDRVVFDTALYHAFLQPMTGSDADGRYRGYDDNIHVAEGWTYHEYFSLWDTYRTQNQLLAILKPARTRDIARSMLAIHDQMGWLPRWGYANFDTNIMTGDPVTPWLVDLWRFGALQGREREAWQALWQNANGRPPAMSRAQGRAGNDTYLAQGFVPYDRAYPSKGMDVDQHHGGSATLEYALGDCALSQMASALGETDIATTLRERGRNWRRVWDAHVTDKELGFRGFPRPRIEGGSFYVPAHGSYSPRSNHGFHEGTAWQYQWLVQQDVPGLVVAMGGIEQARKRLDAFFAHDDLANDVQGGARKHWVVGPYSYYNQFRYNPNNEPGLHAPWMYTLLGQPWKTATVVRAAQALFTNAPNGVTGNDDLGTMSAWYVFSAIGLYPAVPGTGQLLLHAPRFAKVELDLGDGHRLSITAANANAGAVQAIDGVRIDGQPHAQAWVDWAMLRDGGSIDFRLGSRADPDGWGTRPQDLPASPCAAP
ncbi:GH92 family glycosyl hydrolase [Thermomonas carbonis]|uniref:Glycoside hydrolase family 92 protein n=1 Tax=Thermomonas carbonis TaxID=1463158 RepID=A0A7G9SQD1_9GAMM|nr:GH92 family glycosyl hydrolase [Thermomonas carbonis]QNN70056.1 glycoside hydrolase family 92 protein [Thermomonas carbonis]GHB97429.1 alpha-1 2-mannosidase [Thermomonas carbonis]